MKSLRPFKTKRVIMFSTIYLFIYLDNTSICVWSSWTSWTDCSSTCYKGIQHRVKVQFDTDNECRHNEIFDNKTCFMNQCEGTTGFTNLVYKSIVIKQFKDVFGCHILKDSQKLWSINTILYSITKHRGIGCTNQN